jgi:hypothetical protein
MSQFHQGNKSERKEAQTMKRSDQQFENARWARIAAGDSAYGFLVNNFEPETAIAIAVRVEYFLAVRWQTEQEQMRARRDLNKVFEISIEGMARARKDFDGVPAGRSDGHAEQYVMDLLAKFPADQAWWTARRLRGEIEGWCRREMTQSVQEGATTGVPARAPSGTTDTSMPSAGREHPRATPL